MKTLNFKNIEMTMMSDALRAVVKFPEDAYSVTDFTSGHAVQKTVVPSMTFYLRKEEGGAQGYAKRLRHGEIGKGLNDYDAIFTELKGKGFDGWISIEDGVDGWISSSAVSASCGGRWRSIGAE